MFDLDGTLLPVGQGFFLNNYPEAAAPYFKDIIEAGAFKKALLKATLDMVNNLDPALPNLRAFQIAFEPRVGQDWNRLWPIFEKFYDEGFPKLKELVPECRISRKVVTKCLAQGWEIVLATNPVFPERAIKERMKWCGIDDLPWKFITTIEKMHFCKPHVQYYQEIADHLGLEPGRTVMVGNDMQEDMVASKLGIKTILVEDYLLDRREQDGLPSFKPHKKGRLEDVPAMALSLRGVQKGLREYHGSDL